jgi:hypothetical protein
MKIVFVVLAFLLAGCAGTLDESRGKLTLGASPPAALSSPERCGQLSDRAWTTGMIGAGAGFAAGSAGLSTIMSSDHNVRLVLGLTSVGLGALGAGMTTGSLFAASSYSQECVQPKATK